VTIRRIADTIVSTGRKTTSDTVADYVAGLKEAFLFYEAKRYDISGKKYLSTNSKFFPVDQGIRFALLGSKRPDRGHALESLVFMELKRLGYDVYVGSIGGVEVDFTAMKKDETLYIQVAQSLHSEEVYQRELAPLKKIRDSYPKLILSEDHGRYNESGITLMNIAEWLLGD
jgi:predicted AAA+ superfamily ATPase